MADLNQDPEPQRSDWTHASRALQRHSRDTNLPLDPNQPLAVPESLRPHSEAVTPAPVKKPDGVVASYKANKIERKAALAQLDVWYEAQLEVTKTRLAEVVRVRKAEATVLAEQFLRSLNDQHLQFLTDLGLRSERARSDALLKLGDQTTETMRQLQGRDWPPEMVEEMLGVVIARHRAFMKKLSHDLGEQ